MSELTERLTHAAGKHCLLFLAESGIHDPRNDIDIRQLCKDAADELDHLREHLLEIPARLKEAQDMPSVMLRTALAAIAMDAAEAAKGTKP